MTKTLPDNLTVRPATAAEIEGIVALNTTVHDATVGELARQLMTVHPHMSPSDFWVGVTPAGQVVSSQCLIPGHLRLGQTIVPYCEVGLVGTLEPWRGKGLASAMMAACHADLARRGALLTLIAGIPYFYRRYGYEYSVPLDAHHLLDLDQAPADSDGFTFRLAEPRDAERLNCWRNEVSAELDLASTRDEAIWRYQLADSQGSGYEAETWLVDRGDETLGYARVFFHGFGQGLILGQASHLPEGADLAVLAHARRLAIARGKPHLRLDLPASHPLVLTANALGARCESCYAWQVRVADPVALLSALAPELERRAAGLTAVVHLGLYGPTVAIELVDGRVTRVGPPVGEPDHHLHLPPPLLAPLALGYRTLPKIREFYLDAYVARGEAAVFEQLFPALTAWVEPVY
ncbi:MAG: GNAT family N-acetyltransferase [Armatimonadetes bacterium]|nr:GNAT family N-acetyltransferase [Armatimonadota bacterium]